MESNFNNSDLLRFNINTKGQCLFIQRWREIFNDKTIDRYKCRLTNAHSILDEYLDVLKKINQSIIKESNLLPLFDECLKKIKDDSILKNNHDTLRKSILENLNKKQTNVNKISNLEVLIKDLNANYLNWILSDLKNNLLEDNLHEIQLDIEILATELVSRGWNKKSLYRLLRVIFLRSNEEFYEKWSKFTSSLTGDKKEFICYIEINQSSLNNEEMIELFNEKYTVIRGNKLKNNLIQRTNYNELNTCKLYLEFKQYVYTDNLDSFIEYISQELANIESEFIYFNEKIEFNKSKVLVLLSTNRVITYNMLLNNTKEYFKSSNISDIDKEQLLRFTNIKKKLENNEIDTRLKNVLNQYKLGYSSDSIENWFSSFWFALESLVATNQYENIIEQIINITTPILTLNYPKEILKNLIGDCNRCEVDLKEFDINGKTDEDIIRIAEIIKDNSSFSILIERSAKNTLLTIRIKSIQKMLQNSSTLKKFYVSHYENLEFHLKRLYRIRNSFVHSANIDYDLYPVTIHLYSYLRDVLEEIFVAIEKDCSDNIEEIFSCSNIKYNMLIDILNKSGKGDFNVEILCFNNSCSNLSNFS